MASKERVEPWLEDFTVVLNPHHFRVLVDNPRTFEVFTGSKGMAAAAAIVSGLIGGVFGASLVNAALWSKLWLPPSWLVLIALAWWIANRLAARTMGPVGRFMVGWCFFWGVLMGMTAGWGAQLKTAGWAYGIAGGFGFIVGITEAAYEHPDMKGHDGWFMLSALLGPLAAVLCVVLARHGVLPVTSLANGALLGALAAGLAIAPLLILLAVNWDNAEALGRTGALYLHSDSGLRRAAATSIGQALRMKPNNAYLIHLQAMSSALDGDDAAADVQWRRHLELEPKSVEPLVGRAMVHLRNDKVEAAIPLLEEAVRKNPKHARASATLALAMHRRGDLDGAIALYEKALKLAPDALTMTRMAQAELDAGRPQDALIACEDAISELDSIHGRTWLVRARAHLALGDRDKAEEDFREALEISDETDIYDEAQAGLESMGLQVE
jgi:Flp pilus assembly protein TadD